MKMVRDYNMEDLKMLTTASAEEVKKLVSIESDSTTSAVAKRDIDAVEVDKKEEEGGPSKKKIKRKKNFFLQFFDYSV